MEILIRELLIFYNSHISGQGPVPGAAAHSI